MERKSIDSLRFENVTFGFDSEHRVFEACDFDFPMNKVVWVKAESGAGRSTLIQLLGVLQMPQKGSYIINGENICDMSFEEFLPYRLNIGFGFDQGGVIHNRTITENLMLPLMYHKCLSFEDARDRVESMLNHMGVSKYKNQRPSLVPGSIRKVTCLLRALVLHPEMVLLDDPSVGLGQEVALKYFDLVKRLQEEGAIRHLFISSFDEKLMSLLDHTEVFIDSGLIHHQTEPQEKKVVAL